MVLMLVLDAQIAVLIQHAKMIVNAGIINYFCFIIIIFYRYDGLLDFIGIRSVTSYIVYYFIPVIKNCFFFFFFLGFEQVHCTLFLCDAYDIYFLKY